MLPLLNFIDHFLIGMLIWIIIISAVMSWLIAFNVINLYNPFVRSVWDGLNAVTEPMLRPFRRFLPNTGGMDLSPMLFIIFLIFIRMVVIENLRQMVLSAG